jgi:formamidopyrimidine-DNA glycosylase
VPESPEIQAHAERLTHVFAGATLSRFDVVSFTALKTFDPRPDDAVGAKLADVGRRGKHLLLDFGELTFVVHLMQGGRLRPDAKQSKKPRGGLARWVFGDNRALLLTEAGTEKRAGVWVVPTPDALTRPPLDHLGPEADAVTRDELAALLGEHSMRLHGFLRDQRLLAGVGRRLANEICYRARLSPFATTAKLKPDEIDRLHEAITVCIAESLDFERGLDEMSASKERPGAVHHHTGEPCPVCGDEVREVSYVKYTVNYCPTCQTGGKILADNTTSKFLK